MKTTNAYYPNKKSSFIKELENIFQEFAESGRLKEYFLQLDLAEQVAFIKSMAPYVLLKAKDRQALEAAQESNLSAKEYDARHLQWYIQIATKAAASKSKTAHEQKTNPVAEPIAKPVAEPEVEPMAEPVADPVTEPGVEPEVQSNPISSQESNIGNSQQSNVEPTRLPNKGTHRQPKSTPRNRSKTITANKSQVKSIHQQNSDPKIPNGQTDQQILPTFRDTKSTSPP